MSRRRGLPSSREALRAAPAAKQLEQVVRQRDEAELRARGVEAAQQQTQGGIEETVGCGALGLQGHILVPDLAGWRTPGGRSILEPEQQRGRSIQRCFCGRACGKAHDRTDCKARENVD